jgi:16S rRNA (guanine966-N2)-methyltransferase
MRIIAGSKARMKLLPPADRTTRPITDRVKESLFAILQPKLIDAYVADLFCGTGSLGLEALSRQAKFAVMVEKDREALLRLRKNIAKLGFANQTSVVSADVFQKGIPPTSIPNDQQDTRLDPAWNVIFVDPPYRFSRETDVESPLGTLLHRISAQAADRATVIVRHEKRSRLLAAYADLHEADRREYGSMALSILEKIVD